VFRLVQFRHALIDTLVRNRLYWRRSALRAYHDLYCPVEKIKRETQSRQKNLVKENKKNGRLLTG
jgi:hypothetical protein